MQETMPTQESEFVAFLAIDWADRKHAWALRTPVEFGWLHFVVQHALRTGGRRECRTSRNTESQQQAVIAHKEAYFSANPVRYSS